jgi:hypothetical protein
LARINGDRSESQTIQDRLEIITLTIGFGHMDNRIGNIFKIIKRAYQILDIFQISVFFQQFFVSQKNTPG